MTRPEKVAMAQGLRSEGLLLREIAERMGIALSTAHGWLSDPDGSRLKARKDSYRGVCEDCGAPTDGSNGKGKAPRHCLSCDRATLGERTREAFLPYQRMVEEMWAEGMTCQQIADALGWANKNNIAGMRLRGYNLPHRRTAEQVARIGEGWAKARAKRAA